MRMTYHLVPLETWHAAEPDQAYAAPSLETEGCIHCTDGADAVIATAERYYRDDPRPYVALAIDLDATGSPWRRDDPGSPFPHIYGPIARAAILAVLGVVRAPDGRFIRLAGDRGDVPS